MLIQNMFTVAAILSILLTEILMFALSHLNEVVGATGREKWDL